VTTTTARPIRFHIDGIEVGSGKLYRGALIDCPSPSLQVRNGEFT
jgi:hypothetical protein